MPKNLQMYTGLLIWVVVIVAFYFLLIRPQKKKDKQLKEMRDSLSKGDTVVTIGGIIAKVARVDEDSVVLEIGPSRTKVPFEKWAIGRVVEKRSNEEVEDVSDSL